MFQLINWIIYGENILYTKVIVFSKVKSGSLLIDSSTIDPFVSKEMEGVSSKKGAIFMDAPVSGGLYIKLTRVL